MLNSRTHSSHSASLSIAKLEAKPLQVTRFERMIQILSYLQSGPRYGARELAQEFRVTRRTIFRDIALLREMGVPVIIDESNHAYHLASNHRTVWISKLWTEELATLILGAHLSLPQAVPTMGTAIRDATSKVLQRFPEDTRLAICNLLSTCELDFGVAEPTIGNPDILKSILQAIRIKRQVRIVIPNGRLTCPLKTKVAPYRVVASPESWLLVGRSSFHRKTCCFNIGEIRHATITEDPYTVPRGFLYRSHSAERVLPIPPSRIRAPENKTL